MAAGEGGKEEVAAATQAGASGPGREARSAPRRLTKEGEGAALRLPVRPPRAPPRAPRSPAVPSGAPAPPPPPPPPLWEATWTSRFGPLAKSPLQAAAGPLVAGPLLPSCRCRARRPSGRGTGPGHLDKRRDGQGRLGAAGERGSSSRGAGAGESERTARRRRGAGPRREGGSSQSASPGGGASESKSDTAPRSPKSSPREAQAAWVPPGRCASPWHARWKVFKATKARPGARELPSSGRAARLSPPPNQHAGTARACGRQQVAAFRDPEALCLN